MDRVESLTPSELSRRLGAGHELVLIDVRESSEWQIGHIAGAQHVPLADLGAHISALDPDQPTVCICHHGIRSHAAAVALLRRGFAEVYNLAGGMDRWAIEVDSTMRRY